MALHPGFIPTKNPVKSFSDVKGLRIKANAENADIVKALGGSPVPCRLLRPMTPFQGACGRILFPLEALQGLKIAEVVKTIIEVCHVLPDIHVCHYEQGQMECHISG